MRYLILLLLLAGCSLTVQIDTDYASQNGGGGSIEEEVTTEATTTPTVDTTVDVEGAPL
ncbi:hypothetical protein VPHK404_0070 [Vibrio phage K404]|nr:hypothetical protein SIPHO068v1_p0055 [Vibrio phage 51E28.4]QZI92885.1 hypothetical protein SIPHO067v1_p0045 [Vibrio phage 51E28.1]